MRRSYPEIPATTGLWHTQHRTPATDSRMSSSALLLQIARRQINPMEELGDISVCVRLCRCQCCRRLRAHASSGRPCHCTVQRRTGLHHVVSNSHLHGAAEYCPFIETFTWILSAAWLLLSQGGHVPMPAPVPTPAVRWLGWPVAALRTPAECGAFSMFRFLRSAAPACHLAPAPRTTRRRGQLAPGPGHTVNA